MPPAREAHPIVASLRERLFLPGLLAAGSLAGVALGIWLFAAPPEVFGPPNASFGVAAITPAPAPIVGAPAPDFLLISLDSRAVQLSKLRGAPVVIVFWATWCEPCRIEMPELNAEAAHVKVLAVNFGEPAESVTSYVNELKLDALSILLDPDFAARDRYLVSGLPATFLVDANGFIRFLKIGSLEKSELDDALSALGGNR